MGQLKNINTVCFLQIPTGRIILTKNMVIGNQYAQEKEPMQVYNKEPVVSNPTTPVVANNQTAPNMVYNQTHVETLQRLQASPPPPPTQPYVPPGKVLIILANYYRKKSKLFKI